MLVSELVNVTRSPDVAVASNITDPALSRCSGMALKDIFCNSLPPSSLLYEAKHKAKLANKNKYRLI
jgi:hypothetical protein